MLNLSNNSVVNSKSNNKIVAAQIDMAQKHSATKIASQQLCLGAIASKNDCMGDYGRDVWA